MDSTDADGRSQGQTFPERLDPICQPEYVKVCSTCHQAKIAATSFNFATTPDGFSPSCHSCAAAGASGSQSKAEPKQRRIVTEPTVTEKVCSRCEIKQPAADFPRDKYRSDGLKTTCKACNAICSAAWRKRLAPVPEPRVAEKTCKKCKETKLAGEFYRDRNNPDGLNRYCKSCSYYAKGAITAAEAPDPTANLASSDRTKVLTNGRSVSLPALAIARNSLDGRGSFEGRSSMDGRTSLEGRGGPSPGPDQSGVSGSPLSSSGPEQVVALQAENNRLVTALSQACAQAHHLAAQLSMAQQEVARLTKAMQNARVSTPAPQDSPSEPQQLQSMDTTQTVDAPAPAELPPTIEPLTERGEWDQQTMDTTMLGALHQAWMEQQGQSGSQQAPQQQQAQQPPQGWMVQQGQSGAQQGQQPQQGWMEQQEPNSAQQAQQAQLEAALCGRRQTDSPGMSMKRHMLEGLHIKALPGGADQPGGGLGSVPEMMQSSPVHICGDQLVPQRMSAQQAQHAFQQQAGDAASERSRLGSEHARLFNRNDSAYGLLRGQLSGVRPDAILNGMASGHPNELQSLAFGAPLPSGVKAEPEQFNISAVAQFLSGGAQARTAFGPRLHGQLPRSSSRGFQGMELENVSFLDDAAAQQQWQQAQQAQQPDEFSRQLAQLAEAMREGSNDTLHQIAMLSRLQANNPPQPHRRGFDLPRHPRSASSGCSMHELASPPPKQQHWSQTCSSALVLDSSAMQWEQQHHEQQQQLQQQQQQRHQLQLQQLQLNLVSPSSASPGRLQQSPHAHGHDRSGHTSQQMGQAMNERGESNRSSSGSTPRPAHKRICPGL